MMIPEYTRWLERNQAAEKTIKNYVNKAQLFIKWLDKENIFVLGVTPDIIFQYHQFLMVERKQKASTRSSYLGALRSYFEFLLSKSLFPTNPAKAVRKPKVLKVPPNSLDEEEIEKLMIAAFDKKNEKGLRDLAIIAVLAGTGCRVSALTALRLNDFRPAEILVPEKCQHCAQPILTGRFAGRGKKIKVTMVHLREKGGKEWDIILPEKAAFYLSQYLSNRETGKHSDIVFPVKRAGDIRAISRHGVIELLKRNARKAGLIRRISPHCFRHAALTWLLDIGTDPEVVQRWFGHRALQQTMEYRNKSIRAYVYSGIAAERNLLEQVKTPMDVLFNKLRP